MIVERCQDLAHLDVVALREHSMTLLVWRNGLTDIERARLRPHLIAAAAGHEPAAAVTIPLGEATAMIAVPFDDEDMPQIA